MKQPNIVLFLTDGQRADSLGCYGNPVVRTPHIDAFAGEAARFASGFCPNSVCMPTRATLFTGRYPHAHRVWANGIPLRESEVTLAQALAGSGYRTFASGKLHFEPQQAPSYPPRLEAEKPYYGFQQVHLSENRIGAEYLAFVAREFPRLAAPARRREALPEEAHELTWIVDNAIAGIRREAAAGRPFFCFVSFHELSPPCTPPLGFANAYDPGDMPAPKAREGELDTKPPYYRQCYEGYVARGRHPDDARRREYLASYYSQATFLDHLFGRLVAALKEAGAWDDTITVYGSDHGLLLNDHWQWRHGPFLHDPVINVPLIVRAPGAPAGQAVDALVETVDLMPTLLDLAGVPVPAGVQGRSLRPLLFAEPGAEGKDCALAEEREPPELLARGVDPTGFRATALRTRDWKLIHYAGAPYGELYHLPDDPDEFENLWADPGHRSVRAGLQARLLDRLVETEDPLPARAHEW